jgi:hypothetical protein
MEGDPLADVLTLASARCVRNGTLKAGFELPTEGVERSKSVRDVSSPCARARTLRVRRLLD